MKGKDIIKEVLRQRRVKPEEFFGATHLADVVAARRIAARRLSAAGFRVCAIARLMKRNHSTVTYWTRPGYRARRKIYYAAYWAARRVCVVAENAAEARA